MSVTWAHHALIEGKFYQSKLALGLTIFLGVYLTLAIRLAANMIAGHLLLTLLGGQGGLRLKVAFVIISLVLLLILECAVACIQSYVFTIPQSLIK